jgi:hypothetical protein
LTETSEGHPRTKRTHSTLPRVACRCWPEPFKACSEQPLWRSKWLAPHACVDGIEDGQAIDIWHATHDDRIAQILNFAICVRERRPLGKVRTIRITRPRETTPVAEHLVVHLPINVTPAPRLLIQMVEDIAELREMARAPTFIHRTGRKRWLLSKRIIVDRICPFPACNVAYAHMSGRNGDRARGRALPAVPLRR